MRWYSANDPDDVGPAQFVQPDGTMLHPLTRELALGEISQHYGLLTLAQRDRLLRGEAVFGATLLELCELAEDAGHESAALAFQRRQDALDVSELAGEGRCYRVVVREDE